MKISKDTLIRYTVKDINDKVIQCTFTLEQIEGSAYNFYQHLKDSLKDVENFDVENSEIVDREIVGEVTC